MITSAGPALLCRPHRGITSCTNQAKQSLHGCNAAGETLQSCFALHPTDGSLHFMTMCTTAVTGTYLHTNALLASSNFNRRSSRTI
jgi:hypothetical protein